MRLTDLAPQFLAIIDPKRWRHVDSVQDADGISFLCPKCFAANGGRIGTHTIICWRPRVPQDVTPGPGRWEFEGTGYDDLTFRAGSSSVLLTAGCRWHGFVTGGSVTDA